MKNNISAVELEQIRIAENECDDCHGHNSIGCYGQGEYLPTKTFISFENV